MEKPTVVFLSLCDIALSLLVDFFFFCYSQYFNVCEAVHFGSFLCIVCSVIYKKKSGKCFFLRLVSLGGGIEGLSNRDSYFILSIIYGESRFRKGH